MSVYSMVGPALPEPMGNHPVEQPIRDETGNPPERVRVHTELDIPIYFDPASAQFSAQVGPVQGKGESAELHSADFAQVVERIRERTLVIPVQGYLVTVNHQAASDTDLVSVRPCTVIEYHARRRHPYVIRMFEEAARTRWERRQPVLPIVERIRTASDVMLPETEHIEAVRAAQRAVLDEEHRHHQAQADLSKAVQAALDAIPRLTVHDLRFVQETQRQVAQAPEDLGVTYDVLDDDTGDSVDTVPEGVLA